MVNKAQEAVREGLADTGEDCQAATTLSKHTKGGWGMLPPEVSKIRTNDHLTCVA